MVPLTPNSPPETLALQHVLDNILAIPESSPVRSAFQQFWIFSIHDLMSTVVDEDLKAEFTHSTIVDDIPVTTTHHLPPMLLRNICLLQQWFKSADSNAVNVWFTLNEPAFTTWKRIVFKGIPIISSNNPLSSGAEPHPSSVPTSSEAALFQRSIKQNPSDYTKFKDDSRWKQWHRHLKATVNSHGLTDVLNPDYIPSTDDEIQLFTLQNTFMYSVFESTLQTTKSRHIVQTHECSADAQQVYATLLDVYEENLTISLQATDLRSTLTLLRYDDKWKKSSETFLLHWQSNILELEQLEDKLVDESTKRLWLTATLSTKSHMATCLNQAKVTEMTILGMNPGGPKTLPWEGFYNLILSQAKLHDHSHAKSSKTEVNTTTRTNNSGRGRGGGRGGQGGRSTPNPAGRGTPATNPVTSDQVFTTVTGASMVMKAHIKFVPDEWKKLTPAQKAQLRTAKGLPSLPPTPRTVNTATTQPPPPDAVTTSTPEPGSHLRTVLSNRSVRSNNENQLTINGETYQRIVNLTKIMYKISNASLSTHLGSLIDGGSNGGLSGEDVCVIEQTLFTADVLGLDAHLVSDLPLATVAGVISTSQGPIIGIFHQYAHLGKGKTIHSSTQLRQFGIDVHDTPISLHGLQCLKHPDGYVVPLSIRNGLAYMDMHPPTDLELESYPHVFFTSDNAWDPSSLDHEYSVPDIQNLTDEDHVPSFESQLVNNYGEIPIFDINFSHVTKSAHDY